VVSAAARLANCGILARDQSYETIHVAVFTCSAAEYEHRLHLGTKAVYHLEAFVAKFMSIYKKFLLGLLE
jgi:hypothetical protein